MVERFRPSGHLQLGRLEGFELVTILMALIRSKVRRFEWLAGEGVTFGWNAALTTKLDL
jgi:hypothetical protein